MTLDKLLTAQKCTVQKCRQGQYCLDVANTHHNISRQDIEYWLELIEAGNMEFDVCNPPLNLVNRILLNSQAKTKATGIKKTRNISKDSSSVSQSPVLLTPHPYYAILASGLGYLPMPPYFIPPFIQPKLSVQSWQPENR